MSRPVSRSEFARKAGVSPAAVTKWCKNAGSAACVGARVDLEHDVARQYLTDHGVDPDEALTDAAEAAESDEHDGPSTDEDPNSLRISCSSDRDFDEYGDLTLRELIDKYGTVTGVSDWLDSMKKIVDIHEKNLKNAEREGQLIPRELVQVHVFGAIESANRRLLSDAAKTIAHELYPMARRGDPVEAAEKKVRELIGKIITPVKVTAARVLREA
jgi:hypothetical protein